MAALGRASREDELNIETGPQGSSASDGTSDASAWPDSADHRLIRRWIVRLLRPGVGSGSGILVGPDLVLTCRHVLQDLFGTDPPHSIAAAGEIVVTVGLSAGAGAASVTRYLRLAPDAVRPSGGPAWDALPGSGEGDLDFALIRLDLDLGPDMDWLSFQEFQSPERLAAGAAGAPISFFMYHFPDPADGTPYIEPRLSCAVLPQDWNQGGGRIAHRVASEKGSSGAMLFATVGDSRPFPIALHRGRFVGADSKLAVALSSVLQATAGVDRKLFLALSTPPAELRRQRKVQELAGPQVKLARYLMDRDVPARTTVAGTIARAKKVQPVFEATPAEIALFQARLINFDLPLRQLSDPDIQQRMRCWSLAGGRDPPPVEHGLPRWGVDSLGGEDWLTGGQSDAVDAILSRMADARALGASVLLTAQVDIQGMADYKALEELLIAFAQALQGPEAEADVLVLLWIGDAEVPERLRAQGREALRGLWGGRAVKPIIGMPVHLSALALADLSPWAEDMAHAFKVQRPEIDLAIGAAWEGLDRIAPSETHHAFEPVAAALDPSLQSWVQLHFRRHFEAERPQQ